MAAIIACKDYLLLTNGTGAGILHFSSPQQFQHLPVPNFRSVSRGDPVQASLPPQHKGTTPSDPHEDQGKSKKGQETVGTKGVDSHQKNGTESAQPNYIRATAISHAGDHVAICDDRKYLHVFKVEGSGQCELISSRSTARRCTDVCFSSDDSLVLVADKSGDAYSFPTLAQRQPQGEGRDTDNGVAQAESPDEAKDGGSVREEKGCDEEETEEKEEGEDENEEGEEGDGVGDGTLVLGHLSMLLGVMLVDGDQKIVTCDRDEKIRISRFPDAYNILAYCLGHTEFVINLAYCGVNKILLSASGDCTVRAWTLEGRQLGSRNVLNDVPQDERNKPSSPISTEEDTVGDRQHQVTDNTNRPSIRQMSYCQQCSLLFVAMERSPSILVYTVQPQPVPDSSSDSLLQHVAMVPGVSTNLKKPASESGDQVAESESISSVAGLCVSGCTLWVLRYHGDQLSLTAYTVTVESDSKVKISPVSAECTESKAVKTISEQDTFLRAQSAAEDLLPFLWKSSFQDGFKLQCNLKRGSKVEDATGGDTKKGRSKKKGKFGEKER